MDARAQYDKDLADYLAGKLTKEPEAPPDIVDNTTVEGDAPAATAPAPGAPAAPAPPAPAAPAPGADDLDEPLPNDGSLPKRIKIAPKDPFDLEVLSLRKRDYDWTTAQEMAARRYPDAPGARAFLAHQKQQAPAPAPGDPPPGDAPTEPTTLEELDDARAAAETELDRAMIALDEDGMAAARGKLRALNKLEPALRDRQSKQADTVKEAQSALDKEFNDYLTQAEGFYPAAKDPNSPLSQRAKAIQEELRVSGNPLYHEGVSALVIFDRAARDLGVQRGTPPAAPPAAPISAPASTTPLNPAHRKPPASQMIASGNSPPTKGPQPPKDISKMNRAELEAFQEEYLASKRAMAGT